MRGIILKLKQLSTELNILPQNGIFFIHSASNNSLYLYLIYERPLCKILYQYINKYGYYKYFPISRDFFSQNFDYFTPKIAIVWTYSAWHHS